jgi:hypothetical protein
LTGAEAAPVGLSAAAEPVRIKTLADAERAHITATLHKTNWVVAGRHGAAAQLGLPRTTLLSKMQRLGIPSETSRSRSARTVRGFLRVIGSVSSDLNDESAARLRVIEPVAS